jgi:hypothetical protein
MNIAISLCSDASLIRSAFRIPSRADIISAFRSERTFVLSDHIRILEGDLVLIILSRLCIGG